LFFLFASLLTPRQNPPPEVIHLPPPMPTGDLHAKSKEQIAAENREAALKDAEELARTSQELRDELKNASQYVVPVDAIKKTKQIEKLARRIRGRLKH
jgi:hypothetical protein